MGYTIAQSSPLTETAIAADLKDRMLGEFRLLRRLGRGGMADVYLAEQTSLGRQVAVKVLRADQIAGADDVLLRRFTHEAKAAAALSHPNIIQVYVIGQQDDIHFIAQEYVQGLNLREYLQKKGPPPVGLALHIMQQVASALEKAAEAGIVHRDVKPENIMITRKAVAKVADFGLAQLTLAGERVNLTQVGVTMGTPLYMSPEQVHGDKLDVRSDIYSLGVTCYQLLAGHPPYRGETALSVAMQHVSGKAEPLTRVRPDLPPALCQIVHRMMARKPEDRYQDAASLLKDLRRVEQELRERPETAAEFAFRDRLDPLDLSGSTPWWERAADWSRRRRWTAYALGCAGVLLVAAAFGIAARPADPLESEPPPAAKVRPAATAETQYKAALLVAPHDEQQWQAVINHPSEDVEYRRKAQEQLGLLYLRQLRLDDAEGVFQELAGLNDEAPEFAEIGTAGLAVIASLRGDHKKSHEILENEAAPLRIGTELRRYLDEADRRNRQELGIADREQRGPRPGD